MDNLDVVGLLGLAAAALAAWFAYPSYKAARAKPDLRLILEAGPPTSAQFRVRLENFGEGSAEDWIATFEVPTLSRFMPRDWSPSSADSFPWRERQTSEGYTITWLCSGSDDSIGSRLHREVLASPAMASPVEIVGRYRIGAARMVEARGAFKVVIDEGRNQTFAITPDRRSTYPWWLLEHWEEKRVTE